MRIPSDLPSRRPPQRRRQRVSNKARIVLVILVVLLLVLFLSARGIAGFYTDYLWFDSLGQRSVFTRVLRAKIGLGVVFTLGFALLSTLNLTLADRVNPPPMPEGVDEAIVERYREIVGRRVWLVRIGISLLLGFIAGAPASSQWKEWLLFNNAVRFGVKDPQFGQDVSLYVFRLPFLTFVVDWLFAAFVIILIVTAVAYYLNGGIRLQVPAPPGQRPGQAAHLDALGRPGPAQGRRVLAGPLRAHGVDPGGRQGRDLHRRQGPAPCARAPGHHLPARRGAPDHQRVAARVAVARHRGRPVGARRHRGRHGLPGLRAAVPGATSRVPPRGAVHHAEHRLHAQGVQPLGRDQPGLPGRFAERHQRAGGPVGRRRLPPHRPEHRDLHVPAAAGAGRLLRVPRPRRRPLHDRRQGTTGRPRGPGAEPGRHPGHHLGGQAPRLHARLRRGARAGQPGPRRRQPRLPRHDQGGSGPLLTQPNVYFGEGLDSYSVVSTERGEISSTTRRRPTRGPAA